MTTPEWLENYLLEKLRGSKITDLDEFKHQLKHLIRDFQAKGILEQPCVEVELVENEAGRPYINAKVTIHSPIHLAKQAQPNSDIG